MELCSLRVCATVTGKAVLENQPDPWNARAKHIKQEFKYRGTMEPFFFAKANEKWSIYED